MQPTHSPLLRVLGLALFAGGLLHCESNASGESSRLSERVVVNEGRPTDPGAMPFSFSGAIRKVRDSVVTIIVKRRRALDWPGRVFGPDEEESEFDLIPKRRPEEGDESDGELEEGSGTGFVLTPDGLILTNHHVIDQAKEIRVRFRGDEQELAAQLVGSDAATDIAVLDIEGADHSVVTLGDSSLCESGDVVLALGSPFGLEQTVTMGVISAVGRGSVGILDSGFEDFIQTDAAINPGNSGGPLIDGLGRVIGINTGRHWGDNIGFAVPVNLGLKIADDLLTHGFVLRGYLGIHMIPLDRVVAKQIGAESLKNGVVVTQVELGTAAEEAGFHAEDVILKVGRVKTDSEARLRMALASLQPGSEVRFSVWRKGAELELDAVLGLPPEASVEMKTSQGVEIAPGLFVADATAALRKQLGLAQDTKGIVVTKELKEGEASRVMVGDQLQAINGKKPRGVEEAQEFISSNRGAIILCTFLRNGVAKMVAVRLQP